GEDRLRERSSSWCRGQVLGRATNLRRLLEGVGEFDESWFAKGSSHEGDADWKIKDVAGRDVDSGIASKRGWLRAASKGGIAVDQVNQPGRTAGGHDQRIELVLVHNRVNAFLSREAAALVVRSEIDRV